MNRTCLFGSATLRKQKLPRKAVVSVPTTRDTPDVVKDKLSRLLNPLIFSDRHNAAIFLASDDLPNKVGV